MSDADVIEQALDEYREDCEAVSEQHALMLDDLRFSNPADPQQWSAKQLADRADRPTFDNTNQYVMQVVNDQRQNKSSIETLPANSDAEAEVAAKLNGMIRAIEYASRADIAYDTALEHAARIGCGWVRIVPQVTDPALNEQEIRITRVHDPFSVKLDSNSTEPDGSDAMRGWVETVMTERAFKRKYPDAEIADWKSDTSGWWMQDAVRLCEYFKIDEDEENHIVADGPAGEMMLSETDYWDGAKKSGFKPKVKSTFKKKQRTVTWRLMSGTEILEETTYPSQWIGLVPVIGHELWIEGKRQLCGMVRGLKGGQVFHNIQMGALAESLLSQPKAPFILPSRAVEGLDQHWQALATGNPAWLPYNDLDRDGNPIAAPIRLSPPSFPLGFANGSKLGQDEMQAAVGMYRSNLGAPSNAVSGRAKIQDQREGDTANFHYIDNLRRSKEHIGRIIVDMIPNIYNTKRCAAMLGEDGKHSFVIVNPDMPGAVKKQGGKVVEINPGVGKYSVRVKIGPAYTTLRQETADRLTQMATGNPQLGAILAPLLAKMQDLPEAEKIERILMSTLPPAVQAAYHEDDQQSDIPPAVKSQLNTMQQQMSQMQQAIQQSQQIIAQQKAQIDEKYSAAQAANQKNQIEIAKFQSDASLKGQEFELKKRELGIAEFEAETQRMQVDGQALPAIQQQIAEFAALSDRHAQAIAGNHADVLSAINQLAGAHQALTNEVAAPVEIARGPDGRIASIKKGSRVLNVVRDETGQVAGAV